MQAWAKRKYVCIGLCSLLSTQRLISLTFKAHTCHTFSIHSTSLHLHFFVTALSHPWMIQHWRDFSNTTKWTVLVELKKLYYDIFISCSFTLPSSTSPLGFFLPLLYKVHISLRLRSKIYCSRGSGPVTRIRHRAVTAGCVPLPQTQTDRHQR